MELAKQLGDFLESFHISGSIVKTGFNWMRIWKIPLTTPGFPGGSDGKVSACNAGDRVWSLGQEDPLEKEMAIHSSTLAWKIPWTEEPNRLQSMGSQSVGHDWVTSLHFSFPPLWNKFKSTVAIVAQFVLKILYLWLFHNLHRKEGLVQWLGKMSTTIQIIIYGES